MASSAQYIFKFLMIGDASVGKTSLVRRLCLNDFSPNISETVGVEFMPHMMNIDKFNIRLQIWDTSGQEQYKSLSQSYYRNAVGALIVFSYDSHSSFEHVIDWYNDVKSLCHPKAQIMIVGNKCDLEDKREVVLSEAESFGEIHDCQFISTSAKTSDNVYECFNLLTRKVLVGVQQNEICIDDTSSALIQPDPIESKPCSC